MTVARFAVYRYCLPLQRELRLARGTIARREGLIMEIEDSEGHCGLGEIAPLPGFSAEDLDTCINQLTTLRRVVLKAEAPPHLEELSGAFEDWLGELRLAPSVRFGFETAVLGALAAEEGVPLERLLSDSPEPQVEINALLNGDREQVLAEAEARVEQGYRCLKLKIGRGPIGDDTETVGELHRVIGPDVAIRLDANRAYTALECAGLGGRLAEMEIEYIEEPLAAGLEELRVLLSDPTFPLPLALDETLSELDPADLRELPPPAAAVLKPTMLGLERAAMFARAISSRGGDAVVSSSFESSIGLAALARFASAFGGRTAAGLDTGGWLQEDLVPSQVAVRGPRLSLEALPSPAAVLDRSALEEISLD